MRIDLPEHWGTAWLRKATKSALPLEAGAGRSGEALPFPAVDVLPHRARAYDHLGRQLVWQPALLPAGGGLACDVENRTRPIGDLARQLGVADERFLERWVIAEVLAKLCSVPILLWLKSRGLNGNLSLAQEQIVDLSPAGITARARITTLEHAPSQSVMAFGILTPTH